MIVQGGTFMSDATLRAFELLTGVNAVRPDIAGCMGAYGAALLARDRAGATGTSTVLSADEIAGLTVAQRHVRCGAGATGTSTVLSADEIAGLTVAQRHVRCGRCSNNCQLTVNDFGEGRKFRLRRGAQIHHRQPLREGRGSQEAQDRGA